MFVAEGSQYLVSCESRELQIWRLPTAPAGDKEVAMDGEEVKEDMEHSSKRQRINASAPQPALWLRLQQKVPYSLPAAGKPASLSCGTDNPICSLSSLTGKPE